MMLFMTNQTYGSPADDELKIQISSALVGDCRIDHSTTWSTSEVISKHINGGLVCKHHDCRVGYLSDQLGHHATVQTSSTILPVHKV
jgi:hypothetical protein